MCAVQFSQQNLYMCAVWWKPGVFTQVGFTLTFPPHILYSLSVHNVGTQGRWVPLGNSLAIIKQHKTSFPGPFRIPSNILYSHFLSPHPSLYISNLKPKHLAIKVSQDGILLWLKQWPKGLPGRRRLQQQISTMCAIPYVFAYVTLIKSTHSLTKKTAFGMFSISGTLAALLDQQICFSFYSFFLSFFQLKNHCLL